MSSTPEAELALEALELARLRAAILDRLIAAVTLLAVVPVVGGIWLSFANDVPVIAAFDAACWLAVFGLWRARLPQRVRALAILLLMALAGLVLLGVVGLLSLGALWLGGVPALAGVLFDRRAFWWASGLVVASLAVLAVAVHGSAGWTVGGQPVPLAWWLTAASSIVCVSCFVGLPAS